MTEKEKSIAGLLYNANHDEELLKERDQTNDLCFLYNQVLPSKTKEKEEILKKLIPSLPESYSILQPFYCDYGYHIKMGENFFSNYNCTILDATTVTFGDNVFIGPNCGFYTAGHPIMVSQRNEGLEYAKPITVGNNVWFGGNVVVLPRCDNW